LFPPQKGKVSLDWSRYPVGEEQDYGSSLLKTNAWRASSEEKRELERLEVPLYVPPRVL
jgi:hypothetical protein